MIVNLTVSNFKGIEKVEKVPCDKVTIFVGDNRQGKTSMLTAIGWCMFGGNKQYHVRNGQNEARVVAETEKAIFDRKLVRGSKKDHISITKKIDGNVVDAQVVLSAFNENCFDPIKFIFLEPKLQSKMIREALSSKMILTDQEASDLGIELIEKDGTKTTKDAKTLCEDAYSRYYSERTEVNRQMDIMKKRMAGAKLDFIPDQTFIDNIEHQIKDYTDRLNEQIKKNARIKAAQGSIATKQKLQDQLNILETEIKDIQQSVGNNGDQAEAVVLELKKKLNVQSAMENEFRGSYNMLKKTLGELEISTYPVCPISNKIICNTDMTSAKEGMKTELEEIGTKLKALHSQNLSLTEEIDSLTIHITNKKSLSSKTTEYERTKAMIENLNSADETPEDDELTKKLLNEKQQELSTAKIARELAALGDIEEKAKRQKTLDDLVKKLRNFIDVDLTKRAKLEINDIEVKDDGIYFRAIPLSEECTSVQLRAACVIMKSLYPKCKILLCDRLEILDKKIIVQFIKSYSENTKDNIQLFGTFVGDYSHLKNIPNVKLIEMKFGVPTEV